MYQHQLFRERIQNDQHISKHELSQNFTTGKIPRDILENKNFTTATGEMAEIIISM